MMLSVYVFEILHKMYMIVLFNIVYFKNILLPQYSLFSFDLILTVSLWSCPAKYR